MSSGSENENNPALVTLRPVQPDDQRFLLELYRTTRAEEMAAWGLDAAQMESVLQLQFTARERHYDIAFPESEHKIILCDNRPAGRILVFRSEREIRLVDIALLPDYRGSGIGASLISGLIAEAQTTGKPVTLHVTKSSRAMRLYERLGFQVASDIGTDYRMEWRVRSSTF